MHDMGLQCMVGRKIRVIFSGDLNERSMLESWSLESNEVPF